MRDAAVLNVLSIPRLPMTPYGMAERRVRACVPGALLGGCSGSDRRFLLRSECGLLVAHETALRQVIQVRSEVQ